MAINIVETINRYKQEAEAQKSKVAAVKRKEILEGARDTVPVVEGATPKLPVSNNLSDIYAPTDLRGKNVDPGSEVMADIAENPALGLTRTEPTTIADEPESIDEITRIDNLIEEARLKGEDPLDVLVKEQAKRGTVLPNGSVSYDEDQAKRVVLEELENQRSRVLQTVPEDYENWTGTRGARSEEVLSKQLGITANKSKDELKNLNEAAISLNKTIASFLPVALSDTGNESVARLRNLLKAHDLIDFSADGKVIPKAKLGNALALQLIQTFNEELVKRDKNREDENSQLEERRTQTRASNTDIITRSAVKIVDDFRNVDEVVPVRNIDEFKESIKVSQTLTGGSIVPEKFKTTRIDFKDRGRGRDASFGNIQYQTRLNQFIADMGSTIYMGQAFNPDYTRGNLARGLLNKIAFNPKEDEQQGIVTGRGGAGETILNDPNRPDSEIKLDSILDALLWNVVGSDGYLSTADRYDPDTGLLVDRQYVISPKGEEFFASTRGLLRKLLPKGTAEGVSYARPVIGQVIASKAREKIEQGPVSIKSKLDKNLTKENRVKDKLGAIPLKIIQTRLEYGRKIVNDIIILNENRTDVVQLADMPNEIVIKTEPDLSEAPEYYTSAIRKQEANKRRRNAGQKEMAYTPEEAEALQYKPPMKQTEDVAYAGRFYSTNKYADALGLDEDNWFESFNNAIASAEAEGVTDPKEITFRAEIQANAVMRSKARDIIQDLNDADRQIEVLENGKTRSKIFYNKYFHASSVGRYFVRQGELNGMNSKFVRNIVGSAQPRIFDLNKKMSKQEKEVFESWKYIIGKNLLNKTSGLAVPTNQMGWNAIINRVDTVIRGGMNNGTYKSWVIKGRKLKETLANPETTTKDIDKIFSYKDKMGNIKYTEDGKILQQSQDEWGFNVQSLIDFANYHDALKAKGTGNSKFSVQAQTSADGIQSGPAIQAMQNGDVDILELVGAIYNTEENILPKGDIRARFYDNFKVVPETTFVHSPEKMSFWSDFVRAIEDSKNKSSIIKDLSKVPLMETSYGRSIKFNHAAIVKFLNKHNQILNKARGQNQASIYRGDEGMSILLNDFNKLMAMGLMGTLNFEHQKTLSNLGLSWSFLDMTGFYEGPFGTIQYVGSKEVVATENEIQIQDNPSLIQKALGYIQKTFTIRERKSLDTGSAPAQSGITIDPETGSFIPSTTSRFGQESANQFVVLPIQQIDAAVLGNTIDKVNSEKVMRDNNGYPLYVFTVHDSITADANSIRQYHGTINSEFKRLNKEYKLQRALVNGFTQGLREWDATISNNKNYTVSSIQTGFQEDLNSHRAIHSFFLQMEKSINEAKSNRKSTADRIEGDTKYQPTKREVILKQAKDLGWTAEGGLITGANLKKLIRLAVDHMNVISELKKWEASAIRSRLIADSILARLLYNYN